MVTEFIAAFARRIGQRRRGFALGGHGSSLLHVGR